MAFVFVEYYYHSNYNNNTLIDTSVIMLSLVFNNSLLISAFRGFPYVFPYLGTLGTLRALLSMCPTLTLWYSVS